MDRAIMVERIDKLGKEHPASFWEISGVNCWPLIRMHLFVILYYASKKKQQNKIILQMVFDTNSFVKNREQKMNYKKSYEKSQQDAGFIINHIQFLLKKLNTILCIDCVMF